MSLDDTLEFDWRDQDSPDDLDDDDMDTMELYIRQTITPPGEDLYMGELTQATYLALVPQTFGKLDSGLQFTQVDMLSQITYLNYSQNSALSHRLNILDTLVAYADLALGEQFYYRQGEKANSRAWTNEKINVLKGLKEYGIQL